MGRAGLPEPSAPGALKSRNLPVAGCSGHELWRFGLGIQLYGLGFRAV